MYNYATKSPGWITNDCGNAINTDDHVYHTYIYASSGIFYHWRRQQLVVQSYSTSVEIQKYAWLWHLLLETSRMCYINIHSFSVVVDEDDSVVIT